MFVRGVMIVVSDVVPNSLNIEVISLVSPFITETSIITEDIPMIMPSIVRRDLTLLFIMLDSAIVKLFAKPIC